jgi:thiol-disulfide isomerase/thioredoxin
MQNIWKRSTRFLLPVAGAALWMIIGANEYSIGAQYAYNPTTAAAPVVDAGARQALDQMAAAYKSADFYASGLTVTNSGFPDSPALGVSVLNATVAWQKPNKINIRATSEVSTVTTISDGATLCVTNSRAPRQYIQLAAPPTKAALISMLPQAGNENSMLERLMRGEDPLRRFGSSLKTGVLKKVSVPGAGGAMQIATDRVAVLVTFARRKDVGTAAFIIDSKTHLLRSFKITQTQDGQTTTQTEVYDNARTTPDETTFEYSMVPGAQRVSSFPVLPYNARLKVGGKPFAINAKDLDGQQVNLDDYKGQVVLLDFWATWCPPCVAEAPQLTAMYMRNKDKGFNIVGLSLDVDKNSLLQFTRAYNMTWRQVYDGGYWKSAVPSLYKVQSIPFTVLVGRDGKIAAIGARGQELEMEVHKALMAK